MLQRLQGYTYTYTQSKPVYSFPSTAFLLSFALALNHAHSRRRSPPASRAPKIHTHSRTPRPHMHGEMLSPLPTRSLVSSLRLRVEFFLTFIFHFLQHATATVSPFASTEKKTRSLSRLLREFSLFIQRRYEHIHTSHTRIYANSFHKSQVRCAL